MSSNCPRTRFLAWILKYTQKPRLIFLFAALTLTLATSARAATLLVTKTADTNDGVCDSDCSLREAISSANAIGGGEIIFHSNVFNVPRTIVLSGGSLSIFTSGLVTITGTGTHLVSISGNNASRVFYVANKANL